MITTSEIKISALVPRDQAATALRAVHEGFNLHERPADAKTWAEIHAGSSPEANMADVVSRLQNDALEALTLTDIAIVEGQARVTLDGVPDRIGVAADMFEEIGRAGIFVDMIVQGYDGEDGSTSVSFTMDETDLEAGLKVAQRICKQHQMRDVRGAAGITKLSVSGIGLRSHTQVGTVLFEQLAKAKINVEMIATSELQVNVVIDSSRGNDAKNALKSAFAEALG